MADLEELQIRITEESSRATQGIEKLAARLNALATSVAGLETGKLNDLATGLINLNGAIATINSTSKKKDYNHIVSNLRTLGNVNVDSLNTLSASLGTLTNSFLRLSHASAISDNIKTLINSISKLGGVGVQRAITNIPLLQTAIVNLITSLSKVPDVSQNILEFTNALANLGAQGAGLRQAGNAMIGTLDRYRTATNRAHRSTLSLASAIGKVYANFWLLIRGARAVKNAFKDTADYLEAYNYFQVTAQKIGRDTFAKEGVGSAEAYADAFTETLQRKLKQMSGLELDLEDRLIKTTNAKSLGLNLTELTQYQASIASITNSMGVSQEIAQSTAKAFSMLAADMGSLKNVDFETVASNLQSGLTGMARSLYKYGIDITQATLEQYAFSYGIEKSVSEMTQAEKAQLRLLAILDQSKVAWGDLANTINSPNNQLRMLKNNLKEIGTVFGQLLIPSITRTLTYLNGLSIAIKRLLVDIAQILGISLNLDEFGGGFDEALEDDIETLDDFNDTLNKTKKGIREFDELKVIGTDNSKSLTGIADDIDLTQQILDATAEYEKVWDEAYDRMKSKAEEIAELIGKALEPIKKIVEDFAIGDFFQAGQDVSQLVISIFDFVSEAISKVDWHGLGVKIGEFIEGIDWVGILKSVANLVWKAIQGAFNLWQGVFDVAPFETALITAFAALKFTGLGAKVSNGLATTIGSYMKKKGVDSAFLTKAGLGGLSVALGLSMTIDNVKDVQTGKYAALSARSLIKSAISSLLLGAGATAVAAAFGATGGTLALVFGVTFALSATFNVISAIFSEPTQQIESEADKEKREWAEKLHLDTMEVFSEITLKGEIADVKIQNIEFYAQKVLELSQSYDSLTDAQKAELKYYSDELGKLVPSITDSLDEITGAYTGSREELEKLIASQEREIKLEAYRDSLVSLEKRKSELLPDYTKAKNELNDIEAEYIQFRDLFYKEGYKNEDLSWALTISDADLRNYTVYQRNVIKNMRDSFWEWKKLQDIYNPITSDWDEINRKLEYYSDAFNTTYAEAFGDIPKVTADNMQEATDNVKKSKLPNEIQNTIKEIDRKLEAGEKPTQQEMVDLFRIINEAFDELPDGQVPDDVHDLMLAIQAAFIKDTPDLLALIQKLGESISQTFSDSLSLDVNLNTFKPIELGNKLGNIRKAVYENANADKSGITKLVYDAFVEVGAKSTPTDVVAKINDLINATGKEETLNAVKELENALTVEFAKLGYNLDIGWAQGIHNGSHFVFEAIEDVSEGGIETFKDANEENSPSKLYRREAINLPLGIALGIEDGIPEVDYAMQSLSDSMADQFGQLEYNVPSLDFTPRTSNTFGQTYTSREDSFLTQLASMASANNGQTEVVFRIEGDPHGMFRVMREQNNVYYRRTGKSAF